MNLQQTAEEKKLPQHHMIWVEGGTFMMGSSNKDRDADADEKEEHEVKVPGFYMGQYPVTQALWQVVMGQNPANFKGPARPVERVSWYDALVFCNRLSVLSQRIPCYYLNEEFSRIFGLEAGGAWKLPEEGKYFKIYHKQGTSGYRLPAESEWEYAARGGGSSLGYRYAGSDKLKEVGWYDDNSDDQTHEVGLKQANELGLYDMSGNVREWCEDEWHESYTKEKPVDGSAWVDGKERDVDRMFRGGSYSDASLHGRVACRSSQGPTGRNDALGFRLALSWSPVS
jgi:formylglycine-generating enzyme required for sulfatase activity